MKLQLKTIAGSLIFEGDFSCIAELVTAALAAKKSLSYANLSYANLSYANLSYANLSYANLSYANLSYADLSYANLSYANLSYANLSYANLSSANLSYADLSYADLSSADLSYADLSSAKNSDLAIARTRILAEGSIIAWKKCRDNVIVKMRVPEDAKRSHAFGRKCRAEFVDVLEVFGAESGFSITPDGPRTQYTAGKRVACDKWCEDYAQECAGGIHFYITRAEAEAHT